jgi:hypothetical protein
MNMLHANVVSVIYLPPWVSGLGAARGLARLRLA